MGAEKILKIGDAPGGNYVKKLMEVIAARTPTAGGGVIVPHILHDDDCPILKAPPDRCTCDPDITVHGPGQYCDVGPCWILKRNP